eukprot:151151-Amphidinium_carterae.2
MRCDTALPAVPGESLDDPVDMLHLQSDLFSKHGRARGDTAGTCTSECHTDEDPSAFSLGAEKLQEIGGKIWSHP